jgi:hypothetical protein
MAGNGELHRNLLVLPDVPKRTGCKLSPQKASEITIEDREALRRAVKSLEHPSLAARLTNIVGKPVELIGYALPSFASKAIASATSKGLETALKVALRTLPPSPRTGSQFLHRALATASGAAGGTFGLAALPVELPVSTVIMLRSIAEIARSEGEDLCENCRAHLHAKLKSRIDHPRCPCLTIGFPGGFPLPAFRVIVGYARSSQPPAKDHPRRNARLGVRGLLVYCSDYHCSHWIAISGDQWPDDVRLSDLEPIGTVRRAACSARPQAAPRRRSIEPVI